MFYILEYNKLCFVRTPPGEFILTRPRYAM